jgi:UDP-N-acetylmuramoylalanine--D-glutamate ligase
MNLPDKILIVGLGKTGVATAKFLSSLGKKITIIDTKTEEGLASALKELQGIKFEGRFGSNNREDFLNYPMIIISPGVDSEMPHLQEARKSGTKIIGEIELASSFVNEPIIAITGTNGKTTVTSLIGEIFDKACGSVFVGGNIGNPLINYVLEGKKAKYVILEISSFQLETIETFRPDTSILLNITEDHLDRYRSYDEYKAAKYRIFENQQETDWAILNKDLSIEKEIKAKKLFFKSNTILKEGAFFFNDFMFVRLMGKETVYKRDISPLVGIHNTENILSALLVSHIYGIEREIVEEVLKGFKGLAHRVEPVRELKGIKFYNDSKATNVDATKRALESMEKNVVLIAGGRDKGGSYKVIEDLMNKVKAMILIGEASQRISDELGRLTKTYTEDNLSAAIKKAYDVAEAGDTVLFSPMCSSFDMFKDYKERGNIFKEMVEAL